MLNMDGIQTPVHLSSIYKFEYQNHEISVNILYVDNRDLWTVKCRSKFCNRCKYHVNLGWPHFVWNESLSGRWSDRVRRDCDQSVQSSRPTSFWFVAATANLIHNTLSSDEMGSSQTRSGNSIVWWLRHRTIVTPRCWVTTLGKLFTPICLCHQAVGLLLGTNESCGIKRQTTWCTISVSVILQHKLIQKRRSEPPYVPTHRSDFDKNKTSCIA